MKRLIIILGLLFCAIPARATITFTQVHGNAACGSVSSCTVSGFSAIAAGSMIIEKLGGSVTTLIASAGASNAGTWVVPSGCTTNADCHSTDATAGTAAVAYILSSTGTPTTIACTATLATITDCSVSVYTFTGASMSFDIGAIRDQTVTGTSYAGTSAGTLTGTNDIIFQYGSSNGTFSGCPNSAASPADFTNGGANCGLINSTNNAAGTLTLSITGRAALGAIAFKEAAGGAAATGVNKQRRYEMLEQ